MITPFNNHVLVELLSNYKHAVTTDARTVETKSKGLCVAVSDDLATVLSKEDDIQVVKTHKLINKIVYFDEFEDTTNYLIDGKRYSLIDIKNIKGYDL
jgi:hypothetical protein